MSGKRLFKVASIIRKCFPIEYEPTEAYLNLFHESLHNFKAKKVATAVGAVSELPD